MISPWHRPDRTRHTARPPQFPVQIGLDEGFVDTVGVSVYWTRPRVFPSCVRVVCRVALRGSFVPSVALLVPRNKCNTTRERWVCVHACVRACVRDGQRSPPGPSWRPPRRSRGGGEDDFSCSLIERVRCDGQCVFEWIVSAPPRGPTGATCGRVNRVHIFPSV